MSVYFWVSAGIKIYFPNYPAVDNTKALFDQLIRPLSWYCDEYKYLIPPNYKSISKLVDDLTIIIKFMNDMDINWDERFFNIQVQDNMTGFFKLSKPLVTVLLMDLDGLVIKEEFKLPIKV